MSSVERKKAPKGNSEKSESKGVTKKAKSETIGRNDQDVDILDQAAMENAYNICHNVQDLLQFRGFQWEGQKAKGKKKGRKKGKR